MELSPTVKKYWPYALGGVIGLVVIVKMRGGSDAAQTVDSSSTAAYLASQAQASAQYAGLALQAQGQQAAIDAQKDTIQKQYDLGVATLQTQQFANNNAAQVANIQAQAMMADSIGNTASQVITALNMPAIMAMNNATVENSATLNAAAGAASTAYLAQVANVKSVANVSQAVAGGVQTSAAQNAAMQQYSAVMNGQNAAADASSNSQMWSTVGTVAGAAIMAFSDVTVKNSIHHTPHDSLAEIAALTFVAYEYDTAKIGPQVNNAPETGILAQQAEAINPDWTATLPNGIKVINMNQLLMSALHALQIANARITLLESALSTEH